MKLSPEELYRLAGEQLLACGTVEIPISGSSMLPTLKPGRDRVRLESCDRCRRGDIVLAKATSPGGEGIFLHRVVAIDGDNVTLMGDHNLQQRERCHQSQILGRVAAIISPSGEKRLSSSLSSSTPLSSRLRRLLHSLYSFLRMKSMWGIGVCSAVGAAASLLFVACTKHVVDLAVHNSDASLLPGIIAMVGAMICQLLFNTVAKRLSASATVNFSNRLRSKLFEHLLRARFSGKDTFHSGDSVNRLTSDVATLSTLYSSTLPFSFSSLLLLIIAFVYLFTLSGTMAIAIAAIMPVALIISKSFVKVSRKLTVAIRERESAVMSDMQESLQHRLLISTLQYTARAVSRFADLQQQFYAATMRRSDITLFASGMVTLGFMAGYIVAFIWCVEGLMGGTVTFGVMTAFMQLVAMVQRPVVDLAGKIPVIIRAQVSRQRLDEILTLPTENTTQLAALQGNVGVRFTDVTFRYPDSERDVLKDFSSDFKPSELSLIMGETGIGKSTLLLLMLGILKPQKGKVEVYSDNGKRMECSEMTRSNFTYVPQGNSLLSGTVRSNLLMADPAASDQEMKEALHAAAADFVLQLPEGLDTPCGERGQGFSEGQAQRIAIARGLLKKGGIIVLDEPTSALDPATEKILMERLRSHAKGKTIIIVTHRMQPNTTLGKTVVLSAGS